MKITEIATPSQVEPRKPKWYQYIDKQRDKNYILSCMGLCKNKDANNDCEPTQYEISSVQEINFITGIAVNRNQSSLSDSHRSQIEEIIIEAYLIFKGLGLDTIR